MNWKIVLKVPPNGPASDPFGSSASLLWGLPVKVKPCQVREVEEPVVAYDQEHGNSEAYPCCKKGEDLRNWGLLESAHIQSLVQGVVVVAQLLSCI